MAKTVKKTKKPAKKTATKKTTAKKPAAKKSKTKKLAPVKKSIIEAVPELEEHNHDHVEFTDGRIDFSDVDHVFGALISAFHPDGFEEDEETDPNFIALWTLFLTTAGWDESEFWEEQHRRQEEGVCYDCGEPLDEHDHPDEDDETEDKPKKVDVKIMN